MDTLARGSDSTGTIAHSTVGQKVVAAVSGTVLTGWLALHLAGNLTLFSGAAVADGYAASLRRTGPLLWFVRGGLLLAVVTHVRATAWLALRARRAAPVAHGSRVRRATSLAARTMRLSGPLLFVFVVFHVAHLTLGAALPGFVPGRVYENVVRGLESPPLAAIYAAAALTVGLHLAHGLWRAPLSLGVGTLARPGRARLFAAAGAIAVALGFASIPVAVVLGVLR